MEINNLCLACGFDLGFPAWDGDFPSDEICPCCGIQFGFDDVTALTEKISSRNIFYLGWRSKWKLDGMRWWSESRMPTEDWDPVRQLENIS